MRLAVLGASGHGKSVADAAMESGWTELVFFDDRWPALTVNGHWPVIGTTADLLANAPAFDGIVVAIGNCSVRWERHQALVAAGAAMASVIHPRATVSRYAQVGKGAVVLAGAVVNVDAVIGDACIINTGATVDHDCVLGQGVHVSPGAHLAGNVAVGALSWVGVGSAVRQGIGIGAGVMVGAGCVVVKPVPDHATVVGVPAAPLKASVMQSDSEKKST